MSNPRRDYQNDVRLNLTATNVVEVRAAYSNFSQGIGRICLVPDYFPGDIRNEYKGDCLYVEVQHVGTNAQIVAYRQWDVGLGDYGRTNIAPTNLTMYINGRGISLQVTSDVARVYYGTDMVIAAQHGLIDITNTFVSGVFPHFEFLNATNTTTATVQIGGLRCRTLSAFTVPAE